ncbi:unnamed protein product [Blepharisma stoltei]|uniref:TIP41-like protein n=1 Tax=Blepharisma stoltei TaxID=1481888 RepID=A0AAU9K3I4_9CILI|nr:unnamed protein product [Blepharisma stoltei]
MERYRAGQWSIEVERGRLLRSDETLTLNRQTGIKIPQTFYGNSFVSFKNTDLGFNYFISSEAALQLCEPELRNEKLYREGNLLHDHINIVPRPIKNPSLNLNTNGTRTDWTFSTPYKGSLRPVYPRKDLPENVIFQISNDNLPLHRLGQDNPILWSSELKFYEDSLEEIGVSTFYMRVRAMQDCFYALLRCYVRINHSLVRILDTRIFHEFESNKILREFQFREGSFDEINANGFEFSPDWYSNSRQSDIIFQYLPVKMLFKDSIIYNENNKN